MIDEEGNIYLIDFGRAIYIKKVRQYRDDYLNKVSKFPEFSSDPSCENIFLRSMYIYEDIRGNSMFNSPEKGLLEYAYVPFN